MKIFICELSVLLWLFSPHCNGTRVDDLQKKIYGLETSLDQDIKILRDTVEINTIEIRKFGALIIETVSRLTDIDGLSKYASVITKHSSPSSGENADETTSFEIKRIGEDVDRVKRAFYSEKKYLHKAVEFVKSEIVTNLNKTLDTVIRCLNKQDDSINISEKKTEKIMSDFKEETIVNISTKLDSLQSVLTEDHTRLSSSVATQLEQIMNKMEQMESKIAEQKSTRLSSSFATQLEQVMNKMEQMESKIAEQKHSFDGNVNKLTVATQDIRASIDQVNKINTRILSGVLQPEDVRLANARSDGKAGILQVRLNGQWGTICGDEFKSNNRGAGVVCKQLGFTSGRYTKGTYFGTASGAILLDEVECSGKESNIFDCPSNRVGDHDCGKDEDVGVICS